MKSPQQSLKLPAKTAILRFGCELVLETDNGDSMDFQL